MTLTVRLVTIDVNSDAHTYFKQESFTHRAPRFSANYSSRVIGITTDCTHLVTLLALILDDRVE